MNKKFSSIVDSLKRLKITGIFDGEIVAYDEGGKASFQSIQNADNDTEIKYHIFDILNLNGVPTIDLPLLQRKKGMVNNQVLPSTRLYCGSWL